MSDRIAFVLPGQGSHRAGMASAWLPAAEDHFARWGAATELDLVAVADDADACGDSTRLGQPAIAATSLAAHASLTDAGVTPDLVAGHSLGELTAATVAGCFTPEEGVRLAAARGRAMGEACRTTPGTMAAVVGLHRDAVEQVVASVDDAVVANVNGDKQVVIAGTPEAIEEAGELLREQRARLIPLPVEGAFHSPAMTPALVALTTALRWAPPRDPVVPLISGLDGRERTTADGVRRALLDGVLAPVRWVDVQQSLVDAGVGLVIEVGPGGVLAGLLKRGARELDVVSVATPADIAPAVEAAAAVRERRDETIDLDASTPALVD